jgi:hypothetical protein
MLQLYRAGGVCFSGGITIRSDVLAIRKVQP